MKKMRVVKIRWNDCRLVDDGCYQAEQVPGSVIGEDVGWLVREDEEDVALALSRFTEKGRAQRFRSISVIPRCQILSIKTLWRE